MKGSLILNFAILSVAFAKTYNESGGLTVMEMENTESSLGLWEQQTSLPGFSSSRIATFSPLPCNVGGMMMGYREVF